MSLPDDYQVEKVSSALAEIKIYIAWDFDGVDELFVWLQNSVDGTVHYQELGDFTVTTGSDGGGVFILVENNQGVSVDVSVARTTPKTQNYDLSNGEALNPEALIATLGKTVKMIQEEAKGYDNQNITSVNPYVVPDKVTRASKIIAFDTVGDVELLDANIVDNAEEWANKAEDSLVSTEAGGNGVDEYSALHHAAKAAQSAQDSADALDDLVGVYRNKYISAKEMTARSTDGAIFGTKETFINNITYEYFEFLDGVDRFIQFHFSFPDEWDRSAGIRLRFHYTTGDVVGSGDVFWAISEKAIADGDNLDTGFSSRSPMLVTILSGSQEKLGISEQLLTLVSGFPDLGERIQFEILRWGSHSNDTYDQPIRLLGVHMQYKELETKVIEWS